MSFVLHVMGGVGNRLGALLSYRAAHPEGLTVEWSDLGQVGGGRWQDAFEPLPGVEFVDGPNWPVTHHGGPMTIDGKTCDNFPLAGSHAPWWLGYRDVKLLPELRAQLPAKPYDAIHMRRTDHVPLAKARGWYIEDEVFWRWCEGTSRPIYCATDNLSTQTDFATRFHERALFSPFPMGDVNEHDVRNSHIRSAAYDIFACARARLFMGTLGSSFSRTIEHMRQLEVD